LQTPQAAGEQSSQALLRPFRRNKHTLTTPPCVESKARVTMSLVGGNVNIQKLRLPGVVLLNLGRFEDDRGYFNELVSPEILSSLGSPSMVQVNQSSSNSMVFRGMHLQRPPFGQAKLVHCSFGSLVDFILDVDPSSPHFGENLAVELDGEVPQSLFIPAHYAHGFLATKNDTKVLYGVSRVRSIEHETSIDVFSTSVGIHLKGLDLALSLADQSAQSLDAYVARVHGFGAGNGPAS
jgi:dTDP-4-dehydrorhamnose 3,5-epimerase